MSEMDRRLFRDRYEAGSRLATALAQYASRPNLLVLALPRGGVPVGHKVALALHAPLDIMLVRKLGVPGQGELAMGAIASGGILVVQEEVVAAFRISQREIDEAAAREAERIQRQEQIYRGNLPHLPIEGRTIILVDDGLATGSSMRAAAAALASRRPEHLAIAVPVAPAEVCEELRREVDNIVCLRTPQPFVSVGSWYQDFSQVDDEQVQELLGIPSGARQVWQ
ncbi:MAG TPA: phosphoribosyltransferase [Gemmatimonadales bacterium]|nr:phosphoribosyltransferase [Gemmatimonadales bacterium]